MTKRISVKFDPQTIALIDHQQWKWQLATRQETIERMLNHYHYDSRMQKLIARFDQLRVSGDQLIEAYNQQQLVSRQLINLAQIGNLIVEGVDLDE